MDKPSLLPSGVVVVGEIEGDTDLVIFGRVDGPIRVGGALVIEESGVVRGHVYARSVTIRGALKGNAFGEEAVRVDSGAKLVGDLTAPRVHVVPGARFRGQVHVARAGEPALRSYDPALHTFSGQPVPTVAGLLAPFDFDERMTIPVPPSRGPQSDAVTLEAMLPEHSGEESELDAASVEPEEEPPTPPPRRTPPRTMPRIGKVRGRRLPEVS